MTPMPDGPALAEAAGRGGAAVPAPPRPGPPRRRRPGAITFLGTDDRSSVRVRVVDGALRCLARHGVAKTTVDDIAREAGLSRATLYRTFPGGRDAVLAAVVETETARFFSALAVAMGEATDLEEALVSGLTTSTRWLRNHRALCFVAEHEPGLVLPQLAFAGLDRVLRVAGDFVAPFLGRWLEPEDAGRAGEWAARIVLAYVADRDGGWSLADLDAARHVVRTFVLPGIDALRLRDLGPHDAARRAAPPAQRHRDSADPPTTRRKGATR